MPNLLNMKEKTGLETSIFGREELGVRKVRRS
jgi:hypothetical protein